MEVSKSQGSEVQAFVAAVNLRGVCQGLGVQIFWVGSGLQGWRSLGLMRGLANSLGKSAPAGSSCMLFFGFT